MAKTLDLYYYDSCPYCQKVLRAIDRMGIKDKITFKNILQSQEAADTLVSVGGKRQVPCLFIDGAPMYESFGGLETIYGEAADQAQQFAMQAAQMGISANDYAEQAVSCGASLKQAFGGDTEKAVQAAGVAARVAGGAAQALVPSSIT